MKLRNALLGAAGAVGAVAAGNALVRGDPDEMATPLDRPLSTYRWRGFDVAYTEAGDPEDRTLVLLHGVNAAGSSHEFRYLIDDLAEEYHVLAPDLPGFGHSDRPPLLYSGTLYVTFVADFLRDVADGTLAVGADAADGTAPEPPTVLASSLVGAYAATAIARKGAPAAELFLVCPTETAFPGRRVWLRSLIRTPVVGEGLYNLITSRPSIEYFLADHGFSGADAVPEEWIDYDYATTHVPGARFAPASFLGGFLNLDIDLGAVLAEVGEAGVPVTIYWGGESEITPVADGRDLAATADAKLTVFEDADLLPHAEFPAEFRSVLRRDLAGSEEPTGSERSDATV